MMKRGTFYRRVTVSRVSFCLLFFVSVFPWLEAKAYAQQKFDPQTLQPYRGCFHTEKEFIKYVERERLYDTLKKVDNVSAGPYKVRQLVRDDPLTDAACDRLPSFLKTMCWGRTLGKYAGKLRQSILNKKLTKAYIGYLKRQTENCINNLPFEDPMDIVDRIPLLGKADATAKKAFRRGAEAYCARLRQVDKERKALKKDCAPVPSLIGKTYGRARSYLWGGAPDNLPPEKQFPGALYVLENGKKRFVAYGSPEYRTIESLKIIRQSPPPGVMADRLAVMLAVGLEPVTLQQITIKGPANPMLTKGTPLQLDAEAVFNNGARRVTSDPQCKWISSDSKVIRVEKGKVELLSPPARGKQYQVVATYTGNGKTAKSNPYALKIAVGKMPVQLVFKATGPRVFVTNQSGPGYQLWLKYSDGTSERLDPDMDGFDKIAGFEVVPSTISVWAFGEELMARFPPNTTGSRFKVRAAYRKDKILLKSKWLDFRLKSGLLIVPDVEGKPVNEAVGVLKQAGFSSSISRYPCLSNEPPGHVVSQRPPAGWSATPGTTIDLSVEGVRVPDVTGKTEKDAKGEIKSVQLRFSAVQSLRFNPAYKPGNVMRQNPDAGQCVEQQTVIVVTLNGSPVSTMVPDLVGKTMEEAGKTVTGTGFRLKVLSAKQHSSRFGPGIIVRQTPAAGAPVMLSSKTAGVITVYLNPALPQIGIHVDPDRRSYPLGQELTFTEDVKRKNPSSTYSFEWFVDGKAVGRGPVFSCPFTTPGRHYVQLVMTSSDPQENDAIIRNIGIAYPPGPEVSIQMSPVLQTYPPGAPVTFICTTENLSDASAYNWYLDGRFIGKGKSLFYTLGDKGHYMVSVGVRRGSNFDEIKAEKRVEVGPPAIKPLGRWVNKFQSTGPATNLKVCSSYWIPGFSYSKGIGPMVSQPSGWSKCSAFDTIGNVDAYNLFTGEQADGHNSGWIAFSPAGTGKIRFKVYGFRFGDPVKDYHAQRGFVRYAGSIDSRGTLLPSSLSFVEKHGRFGILQWQTEEGFACKARIHKFRKSGQGSITAHVFVPGGVDQEGCVKNTRGSVAAPANASGAAGTASPSFTSAIQTGDAFQHSLADDTGNQPGGGSQKASKGNLQNVSVSQRNVTLTFWDHGKQDGDIITIYLNGSILKKNLKLTNKKQSFPVKLNSGGNLFEVEAENEGSIPPNTASVRISHVTKGRGTQIYERKSGQKASMKLYAP